MALDFCRAPTLQAVAQNFNVGAVACLVDTQALSIEAAISSGLSVAA